MSTLAGRSSTASRATSGVQFGDGRLGASLARHRDLPAARLIAAIHDDLLAFTAGTPQPDDLTAVVLKHA